MRLLTSEFLGCLSIRLEQTHSMEAPSDCDLGSCGLEALLKLLDFSFCLLLLKFLSTLCSLSSPNHFLA